MSVVRFKRPRRRLSIRYYLCTDKGPVRVPLRLHRDLVSGAIAVPQFANNSCGGAPSGLGSTPVWNINAAYEHFWNPQWRTSLYGGYAEVSYSGLANAMLCQLEGFGGGDGTDTLNHVQGGCDNNWKTWWIGTRTQWNITSDFYMGVDLLYSKLNGGSTPDGTLPRFTGNFETCNSAGGPNGTPCFTKDVDNFAVRLRVHKDFYP